MHSNLEKLAADMAVLRNVARRHVWNAPNRSFGPEVEGAMAARRRYARELRVDARRGARLTRRENEAWLNAYNDDKSRATKALRARLAAERVRGEKDLAEGVDPKEVYADTLEAMRRHRDTYRVGGKRWGVNVEYPLPRRGEEPMNPMRRMALEREHAAARDDSMRNYGASNARGGVEVHGAWSGPEERTMVALHERNEVRAMREGMRRLKIREVPEEGSNLPLIAAQVLPRSTHHTPSVPLRDVTLANTATGAGSDRLREVMHDARLTRGHHPMSELEAMGEALPGAKRIMQHAGVLPGAPAREVPRYVRHAQERLNAGGSSSPAVQRRLEQIVNAHAAGAPRGRFNRNELRMIDDEFHRKYNPQFPQLLSR